MRSELKVNSARVSCGVAERENIQFSAKVALVMCPAV